MRTVYWSPFIIDKPEISSLAYYEPMRMIDHIMREPIDLSGSETMQNNYKRCPAFKEALHNVFGLRLPYDYVININETGVSSPNYNQAFFDQFITVRSTESRMISLWFEYIFISEEPLVASIVSPHFEDNNFANSVRLVPGSFDIGKWVRPIECAFLVKNDVKSITMNRGDVYQYIKFECDEPVNLQRFETDDSIHRMVKNNLAFAKYKKHTQGLRYYYDAYRAAKQHKRLVQRIQNELLLK